MRLAPSLLSICLPAMALISGCMQKELPPGPIKSGTQFAVTGNREVIYFDMQGILWKLAADERKAEALTDLTDDIRNPRLSPDGTWLAFESFATGDWNIEIMRTDGTERRPVTDSPADDIQPAWTPDGEHLLFTSDRSGNLDIWSVHVNSGELLQLTIDPADDYGPDISLSGLVFVSERGGKTALYERKPQQEVVRLIVAPEGRMHPPRISPDDRYIAWVQAVETNGFPGVTRNELVIYSRANTRTASMAPDGMDIFSVAPAWRDEFTLLLTANGRIQSLNTRNGWMRSIPFNADIALEPNDFEPELPIAFTQRRRDVLGIVDPVMLPDDSVVFTALGDLWLLDAQGRLRQLTDDRYVERDVTASPDGTEIAYISDRGGSMQIWLHELATNEVRRVTRGSAGPRYPTYSPDGRQIAFQQVGPIGTRDFTVRLLDLDTLEVRRLRSAPKIWPGRMSWSADGTHLTVAELALSSSAALDGRNQLVRIDVRADTSNPMPLAGNRTPDAGPVASADGLQLALVIDGALYRLDLNADGSFAGIPQLVYDRLVESPAWNHDGRHITALTTRGLETIGIKATGEGHESVRTLPTGLEWEPAAGDEYIIHAGRLYDGISDEYQEDVDIYIQGERIKRIRPHKEHKDDATVIDASDRTVIPGLIDHHTHFEAHKGEWVGRALLAFGVTTAVEPGGLPYESREHMESWSSGRRTGPRLVFAGPQLDGARRTFHFGSHITSAKRLEWEIERGERLGYGLLKTYRRLRPELQALTVELGHDEGLPVTAHAGLRNLGFGGDRTEHMRGSSRVGYSPKQSDLLVSYSDMLHIYSASGGEITPTLVNQGGFLSFVTSFGDLNTIPQYTSLYSPAYRGQVDFLTKMMSSKQALIETGMRNAQASLKALHDNGVTIVAGTDSPIFPYGLALVMELDTYVQAGLTPAEALQTATVNAAAALGADDAVGSIKKGMLADMVIVDGDPLIRIRDLLNVEGVVSNGRYFDSAELTGNSN